MSNPTIGRPRIGDLRPLNTRLLSSQVDALDAVVSAERARRNDPGFNRTDAMREAVAAYVAARLP
jgi:hypothetical protein